MNSDVGPQREKMLMDLDKFAKTASNMIYNQSLNITFDDVINIKDRHNANTFLRRQHRQNYNNNSTLNSVFVDHMFARTDNPSDSNISQNYVKRTHEVAYILRKMSKSIQTEKDNEERNFCGPNYRSIQQRMINLVDLINAEKFEFEDVQAWRMGASMENIFKDRWTKASNELVRFQIGLSETIPAGGIISEGDLIDSIEEKCNYLIQK